MAELAINHVHLGEQLQAVPGDDSGYTVSIWYSVKGWCNSGTLEHLHTLDMKLRSTSESQVG